MAKLISVEVPEAFFAVSGTALSADDKLAMMELTCRFEWAFDSRHLDALDAILADDVVIDHLYGLAEGKAAAMQMLRDVVPYRGIRHQATNPVCFIDAQGRPAVLSFLMVVQVADESGKVEDMLPRVLAHALVTDVMRKDGDRWRIAGRTFEQMRLSKEYAPDEAAWRTIEETAAERAGRRAAAQAAQ